MFDYIKTRFKESSYLLIIYLIVGGLLSGVVAMMSYTMILVWANFYVKNPVLVDAISTSILRIVLIALFESLFIWFILKVMFTDNGDTILIEIIKHIETEWGSNLIGEYYIPINLSDIEFYSRAKLHINNLEVIREFNKLPNGYFRFKLPNGQYDICFSGDIVVSANSVASNGYVLHIKQYQYKSIKLFGKHIINKFELINSADDVALESLPASYQINSYISRLWNNGIYDYPISLSEDLKDGLKKSRISIVLIVFSLIVVVGIYGFYRGISTKSFLNNFNAVTTEQGIVILTDNPRKYDRYSIYIRDALAILPQKLTYEFVAEGWSIVFCENDLADYPIISSYLSEGTVSGCTFPFYKIIVIQLPEKSSVSNSQFFLETVIHEFGHFFALENGVFEEEWSTLYTDELSTYTNQYALTNLSEGFACEFADYVLKGDTLREKSPKTYNYINKIIQEKYN